MRLSPYLVRPLVPWFKTFPKKVVDRIPVYLWPIGAFTTCVASIKYAEHRAKQDEYNHRF